MKVYSTGAARGAWACTLLCSFLLAAPPETPTSRIVGAANAFLATLDQKQKERVLFAFDDQAQRLRWSNLPVKMVPRAGLSMGELSQVQRTAALAVVSSALSRRGFEKIQEIVEGDEVLKANERNNPMFGKDLFFISILGTPSEKDPWMLQFGWPPSWTEHYDRGSAGHDCTQPYGSATCSVYVER